MNTKATHKRFWSAIAERYGNRFLTEYGATPSKAWVDMLDRYKPDEISKALTTLGTRADLAQHPPTAVQFEQLLIGAVKVRRAELGAANYRRDYWRSRVTGEVKAELHRRGIWFDPFIDESQPDTRKELGLVASSLLDELDSLENATGQRTEGIESLCERRSREIGAWVAGRFVPPTEPTVPF